MGDGFYVAASPETIGMLSSRRRMDLDLKCKNSNKDFSFLASLIFLHIECIICVTINLENRYCHEISLPFDSIYPRPDKFMLQ